MMETNRHDRNDCDGSGWELSKENIQPLSSGRKMSFLCHSLDKADEIETAKLKKELEDQIMSYQGPDPLEPWLRYIEFLEQTCPTGGKMNAYYETMLNKCFQTFYATPSYKNDKRFVEIYIKAVQNFPPAKRFQLIQGILSKGFGTNVSRIYLTMAGDCEAIQNYPEADRILRRGIEAGAQPIEYLHDELANLQYRVAERVSKDLQNENENSVRNFGSSVPVCKFTNEAQNFRVALSPGIPCRAKPISNRSDSKKIPIFQGFNSKEGEENNENENTTSKSSAVVLPLQQAEMIRSDQENNTKPKKWCTEVLPPQHATYSSNQEPIQIYVDEPEIQPSKVSLQQKVSKGVLSERKLPIGEDVESVQAVFQETAEYRKSQLFQGRDREITFEHLRAKEYLRKLGLNTIRALVPTEKKPGSRIVRQVESRSCSSAVVPSTPWTNVENQHVQKTEKIISTGFPSAKSQLEPQSQAQTNVREEALAKEVSVLQRKLEESEHIISELNKRCSQSHEIIEQQKTQIGKMDDSLINLKQAAEYEIGKLQQEREQERVQIISRFEERERVLVRFEEENSQLRQLLNQERELVETLRKEQEKMLQQFEEEKQRIQQDFDRERNESLLSFKFEHHRSMSIVQEEEKHTQASTALESRKESMIGSPPRGRTPSLVVAKPSLQQKLGFTLYESNVGDNVCDTENTENLPGPSPWAPSAFPVPGKNSNLMGGGLLCPSYQHPPSLNVNDDFAMPPPPPKSQIKVQEEDKENFSTDGRPVLKPSRPLSGVLLPSSSAAPVEMIFMEEDNDDDVVKQQEDTGVDFNVTDLTRALEFYPKPLVNSTPERVDRDRTCFLPINNLITKRRRPFANLELEAPKPEGAMAVEPEEPNLKIDIEPIVYDDENNVGNPKENSFSSKSYGQSYVHPEYIPHNLSPIQEASKERWSSGASSSSSNMTRGTVNFSVGSSYNATKSVSRITGRFPSSQRGPSDTFQPPRYGASYTFENYSQNQPN